MGTETIERVKMKFIDLEINERKQIIDSLQTNIGLKSAIIEKDWWITAVLRALFQFLIISIFHSKVAPI